MAAGDRQRRRKWYCGTVASVLHLPRAPIHSCLVPGCLPTAMQNTLVGTCWVLRSTTCTCWVSNVILPLPTGWHTVVFIQSSIAISNRRT